MTLLTFFGCALTAYGPPLAIFFLTIAKDAQLVILMVSSAFFWLISILAASSIWFIAKSARTIDVITVLYSVLLQELFRWFFYKLISRAESGLILASTNPTSPYNRSSFAFVSGLGFGLMSGLVTYITLLVNSIGPGVLISITTCLFILLHITWMMLAFEGFSDPKRKYYYIIWVVLSHLGASYMTLFNESKIEFGCVIGILINMVILTVSAVASLMTLKKVHT
ncbi:7609_t:CDS:2 [Funneliformis caledonium]|uniref:7609_t:CDS:1 n=1 Tax=Funneliformis caledonium TaxID=1117310 RepID=A0A9N8VR77_9GLOM|nr:7609_t:CDS:2 [Funneliformis caledonium]